MKERRSLKGVSRKRREDSEFFIQIKKFEGFFNLETIFIYTYI